MSYKTGLTIGMIISLIIGLTMGYVIWSPSMSDKESNRDMVSDTIKPNHPLFQKNPIREWVIPFEGNDPMYNGKQFFKVIETEIQDQAIFIIWRDGYPKDFKVINKKKY